MMSTKDPPAGIDTGNSQIRFSSSGSYGQDEGVGLDPKGKPTRHQSEPVGDPIPREYSKEYLATESSSPHDRELCPDEGHDSSAVTNQYAPSKKGRLGDEAPDTKCPSRRSGDLEPPDGQWEQRWPKLMYPAEARYCRFHKAFGPYAYRCQADDCTFPVDRSEENVNLTDSDPREEVTPQTSSEGSGTSSE